MDNLALEQKIAELLDVFYSRRIEKIQTLQLNEALLRKNPYLFKAMGVQKAGEIVEGLLSAFMSSSDEGIFGDAFFEPLAKFVSGGVVAPSEGVDVAIEDDSTYKAIAVKSGPSVFNAQSKKRQEEEFGKLQKRLFKLGKKFDPVVGYSYGRKQQSQNSKTPFRELAGQVFWEEITGDPDFYLKIVRLMKDKPQEHLLDYNLAWDAAVNRFTREFTNNFCFEDGTINWDKLVHFNSAKQVQKITTSPELKRMKPGTTQQLTVTAVFTDGSTKDVTLEEFTTYLTSAPGVVNVSPHGSVTATGSATEGATAEIIVSYIKSKKIKVKII